MRKASEVRPHLSYIIIVDPYSDKSEDILARLDMLEYEYMEAKMCTDNQKLNELYEYICKAIEILDEYFDDNESKNMINGLIFHTNIYHYYYLLRFIKNEFDVTDLVNFFIKNHVRPDSNSIEEDTPTDIRIMMCLAESCNCTYKELSKATKLSESTIRYRIDMMNKKYNDPESDYRFKLIDLDRTKRPHVVQLTKYGRLVISAIDPRKTNIKDQKAKIKRVEMAVKVFKSQEELLSSEFKEKCFKS